MMKTLRKLEVERKFINMMKTIYQKKKKSKIQWWNFESFSFRVRTGQGSLIPPLYLDIYLPSIYGWYSQPYIKVKKRNRKYKD